MKTFDVEYAQNVKVTLDESKFTPEFLEEFRRSFYPFSTIEDHAKHLAQLYARGLVDDFTSFIEGYGPPSDFGITFAIYGDDLTLWPEAE